MISVFDCWMALGCQLGSILEPFWVPSWVILGTKLVSNGLKWRFKKCFKKSDPPKSNKTLFQCQESPGEAGSRAHFSDKKQLFEQQLKLYSKLLQKKMKMIETCAKNSLDLSLLLSRSRLSDTPWAKAWRISGRPDACVYYYYFLLPTFLTPILPGCAPRQTWRPFWCKGFWC